MKHKLSKYHSGVNPKKLNLLREYLNGEKILDVGCGNGLYGFECLNSGANVIQLDIADRRNVLVKNVKFIKVDIEGYEHGKNCLDGVIAFDIVEHLDNDMRFLGKVNGWLKKGGRVAISVPNEDNSLLEKVNLAHIHFTDKTHRREYSMASIRKCLEDNGFDVIYIEPHINYSVANVPMVLSKDNAFSRFLAKLCCYQLRFFERLGLLENRVVADWFVVGEKK